MALRENGLQGSVRICVPAVTVVLIAVILSGCLGAKFPGESQTDEEGDQGPFMSYRPINRSGSTDLIRANPAPRETSPACQVIDVAEPYKVLGLSGSVQWEPTSDRTQELRFGLISGTAGNDIFVEGPSPLNLTADEFNVTAGERFGLVLSLIGEDLLDPFVEGQDFDFQASFVVQFEPDREDVDLGLWSQVCP